MSDGGSLRTYLGTAPGVGKTVAMLAEGRRRAENGERVVVGWLEAHDRHKTSRLADGLEAVPPRTVTSVASVPDEFIRSGEVELVDLPAETLRARIASGAVFSAEQVGGALADYFRTANLEALSELARAWIAGTAEEVGADLLARRGLAEAPAPDRSRRRLGLRFVRSHLPGN